jgi:small subunit ribosomal protein S3Ae
MAKTVSSWKSKKLYSIVSPETFGSQEMGSTFASDPQQLTGRTIRVSLKDLTGERSRQHILITFRLDSVAVGKVLTKFKEFTLSKGYLRSRVRKGISKIDYLKKIKVGDKSARIKVIVLTHQGVTYMQKKEIMSSIDKFLAEYKDKKPEQFVQEVLFGKVGTNIYHMLKSVCPIRRIEVESLEML